VKNWIRCALTGSVIRRAIGSALTVGPILIAINHGDAILRGDLSRGRLLQIALTVLVPYGVSTYSSTQAVLGRQAGDSA
jgi:hypothetical protein